MDWGPREFRFIQERCTMEAVSLRKFTSGRRDGRFALVECGRLEAEKMIRTLDANYLSTFPLPRPASGPAPLHLDRPLGLGLRVLLGIGGGLKLRPTTTHHRQTA